MLPAALLDLHTGRRSVAGIAAPGRAGRLWWRRLEAANRGVDLPSVSSPRSTDSPAPPRRRRGPVPSGASATAARPRSARSLRSACAACGSAQPSQRRDHLTTTMGVRHPARPGDGGAARPLTVDCPAAVAPARAAHAAALEAAARHAAAAAAERILAAQVDTTRQRVRALRRRWVPQLTDALRPREIELEEQERQERISARRAAPTPDRPSR